MQAVIPVIGALAGSAIGALLAPKTPKPPTPIPLPTRNDALAQSLNSDSEFRKRQGASATMLTGPTGAEAPSPGTKALLGQ